MVWFAVLAAIVFIGAPTAAAVLASPLPQRASLRAVTVVLAIAGGTVGGFCSFYVQWQPSPTQRDLGFPFPAIIWRLESGQWVDFVGTPITAAMNIALFSGVGSLISLACVSLLRRRRRAGTAIS